MFRTKLTLCVCLVTLCAIARCTVWLNVRIGLIKLKQHFPVSGETAYYVSLKSPLTFPNDVVCSSNRYW
jgi:hypothetical protein